MPFACIFVPDFPIEAILRAEPDLRSQAVAVLEGKPPLQKVFGVNEKARQLGIEPGMTKIQVEPCTQLALRVRSSLQETAAHAALLDCAQSFSPCIEDTAPDTALLDLAGLETLLGPPARLAHDLARRACDLGLEANVATASNPDAACLAARGFPGITVIPEGKEAECLGSLPIDVLFSEGKPDAKPAELAALKTESQEMARLLEIFGLWGVRNLRALAALPEIALSQRLGQTGVRLQQLARGAVERTLVAFESPMIFEEAVELEHPLVLLEPLAFLLAHMLEQLCQRLAARALAAQQLRLEFELDTGFYFVEDLACAEDVPDPEIATSAVGTNALTCTADRQNQPLPEAFSHPYPRRASAQKNGGSGQPAGHSKHFTRTLRLPIPMLDAKTFLKLLQLDLKAHPPGAPILKIRLSAEPARLRAAQGGLFQPPTPEPEKLELTLARIAGMVGASQVGGAELLDTHHPEGFRMQRFVPPASDDKHKDKKSHALQKKTLCHPERSQRTEAPITALRVFRPPARATVTVRDGKPMHIVCPRRKDIQGDILWMAGPWRSSGDWWEQDGWSRDEWDIALQLPVAASSDQWPENTGLALYRLVHDLLSGRWFVEGTYD